MNRKTETNQKEKKEEIEFNFRMFLNGKEVKDITETEKEIMMIAWNRSDTKKYNYLYKRENITLCIVDYDSNKNQFEIDIMEDGECTIETRKVKANV